MVFLINDHKMAASYFTTLKLITLSILCVTAVLRSQSLGGAAKENRCHLPIVYSWLCRLCIKNRSEVTVVFQSMCNGGRAFNSHPHFDRYASAEIRIAEIRICTHHLRAPRHIPNTLSNDTAKQIDCSIAGLWQLNDSRYSKLNSGLIAVSLESASQNGYKIPQADKCHAHTMKLDYALAANHRHNIFKLAELSNQVHTTATPTYLFLLLWPYDADHTLQPSKVHHLFKSHI